MKKRILIAGVMGLMVFVSCHNDKSGDHDEDVHAEEEHMESGKSGKEEAHAGEIVLPVEKAKAAGVVAEVIKPGDFQTVIQTSGSLQSASGDEASVVATMSGIVRMVRAMPEGARVGRGQALFSISSEHMQDGDPADRAGVAYATAKREYERAQKLVKDKIISEKEFNAIKENYDMARIAQKALAASKGKSGVAVTAPITGYVKECLVKNGDYVAAGQPMMSLTRNRKLYLVADVPGRYMQQLSQVKTARFMSSYGGELYDLQQLNGRPVAYGRTTTAGSSYVPVTFEFDTTAGLLPGMAVTVYLVTGTRSGVISVPESALTEEEGAKYVYVRTDAECYEKREVRTGASDGARREILSGIKPGETVVTKGAIEVKLASATNAIPPHTHSH